MEDRTYTIYALLDPRSNEIRYIGMTSQPERRRLDHLMGKGHCYCGRWERKLLGLGLAPIWMVLERGLAKGKARERERWWIAHGRKQEWPLTNLNDGGEGG